MEITTQDYSVAYNDRTQVITCQGALRLAGAEDYASIVALLNEAIKQRPFTLTLDLRQLEFLNSSGINVVLKFVLKVREQETIHLIVQGSSDIAWQTRSLKNFQRLMPSLELILE